MANWRVKERGQIALHHRKLPYLTQPLISLSRPVFFRMADRLRCTAGSIFYHISGTLVDAENQEALGTCWCSSRALRRLISAEILARLSRPRGFASSQMTLAEMRGVISSDYPLITRPELHYGTRPIVNSPLRISDSELTRCHGKFPSSSTCP